MKTQKIPFTVTARTARLIGRENVTNAEGAVIELVKNGYDADARVCLVYIVNQYHRVPNSLTTNEYDLFCEETKDNALISTYYEFSLIDYKLKHNLSENIQEELASFFKKKNILYIFDNGVGMSKETILNQWMHIGTANKLNEYQSELGRLKAGAKGIGRFALDRLGSQCKMFTFPKDTTHTSSLWEVNWEDFEKQGAVIQEVTANLTSDTQYKYADVLKQEFSEVHHPTLHSTLANYDFQHGTLFKITDLRDEWHEKAIKNLFGSLEILTPPTSVSKDNTNEQFAVFLYSSLYAKHNGKVNQDDFDDYDYKLFAEYLADEKHTIKVHIWRNEVNKSMLLANEDLFKYPDMQEFPFDKKTIERGDFEQIYSALDILKGEKIDNIDTLIAQLGKFNFTFYFLKGSIGKEEDRLKFYYREFKNAQKRKEWLGKFGGIRIYRDNFRVRPYGEPNTSASDWLQLGEKASGLSVVAKKNSFKVRPNQVAGVVNISRIYNENLADKSGREGLLENDVFTLFKAIIESIIGIFEDDRSVIAYNLDKLYKANKKTEEARKRAEDLAQLEQEKKQNNLSQEDTVISNILDKLTNGQPTINSEIEQLKEAFRNKKTYKEGFQAVKEELEEKESELQLMRSLASSGLMIAGFAHEFKRMDNGFGGHIPRFIKAFSEIPFDKNVLNQLQDYENPLYWANKAKEDNEKVRQWLQFAFNLTQKERRKRKVKNLQDFFHSFKTNWQSHLESRYIQLEINVEDITMEMYEIDFHTIFENLLINSVEAFQNPHFSGQEKFIQIEAKQEYKQIRFLYKDTATGLADIFKKNPYNIFKPFETSKKAADGQEVGTGLGMWLLKSTVDDYKGDIKILEFNEGFSLSITFNLNY